MSEAFQDLHGSAEGGSDTGLTATIARFESISRDLERSYAELAARAERVEQELVRTNAELERRVAELDCVLEALPTGVLVRDDQGRVTRANPAARGLLGQSEDQLVGRVGIERLPSAPTETCRVELADADGRPRAVVTRSGAIRDGRGSVQILDDRTDHERLSRRAAQSEKLAAMGTLAAGVAHEIRNPLNAVKGFAALLARNIHHDSKLARWAELSIAGCEEAEGIISGLLTFAEPSALELSTIDPHELVSDVLARCDRADDATVEVTIETEPFVGDAIKLRQALRNLVDNALQLQPCDARVAIRVSVDAGELCMWVADAGPGLDPAVAERVLEPFFTTRPEGTGLGLALCHTIARLHGGRLEPSTSPSPLGGAEFRLWLPLVPTERPTVPTADSEA
ncbi:MAG: ATP-binding protein [Planctomycetota bacterium]